MNTVREYAGAKVNLYLDITGKRTDGYHEIRTVMHTVALADEISVTASPSHTPVVSMTVEGDTFLPTDTRNLAVRAAEAFLVASGRSLAVGIRLKKRLPVAAGLAGGSSNAAAVLRAMNRLCRKPLTSARMLALAAGIGSDVPYCYVGGTALCTGRGEILKTRLYAVPRWFVLVSSEERMSTPHAYAALDAANADFSAPLLPDTEKEAQLLAALRDGEPLPPLYNIFETAVLPSCPRAAEAKIRLLALGAERALMSGSGPTVFGVFPSQEAAQRAGEDLTAAGYRAFVTRTAE